MDLITQILRRCADYEIKTGEKPAAIYLGRYTLSDLRIQIHWSANIEAEKAGNHRLEFNGLPVFTVDEEHHVNVG